MSVEQAGFVLAASLVLALCTGCSYERSQSLDSQDACYVYEFRTDGYKWHGYKVSSDQGELAVDAWICGSR